MPGQSQSGVFVQDEQYGWLPAKVLTLNGDSVDVEVSVPVATNAGGSNSNERHKKEERTVQLKSYDGRTLPLQNIDESGNNLIVPDMCDLPSLHEAAILYNLKSRHESLLPYTRVGDIIIAMNPFQWISELYTESTRSLYTNKLINHASKSGNLKEGLDPHVYEVSALAFRGLALDSTHQSILVSGESGAGKTETVKIIMSHLASVNVSNDSTELKSDNLVVRRVLDSNPLLEAFGNAKTVRNDNSSRFGKYIQLQFDLEDATTASYAGKSVPSCVLAGSTCETYLLEKSRVVGHESVERTFHIFYQLLAAPEEVKVGIWDGLRGTTNASFQNVGETDTTIIEKMTDGQRWEKTVVALSVIGISGDILKELMRAICTVMQLGNLTFGEDPSNEDGCVISSKEELSKLSDLMGIEKEHIEKALTYRTIHAARSETYSVPLRSGIAQDSRDAFAKAIYQHVFDWLVKMINQATCAEQNYDDATEVDEYGNIGLLDIFGFESFQVNRFEQFSINYANEKLQQKYNLDIFSSVQTEYEYEGIDMPTVDFSDNSEVLHLIEGRMGLISMLNEECLRPHGNDTSFVSKIKTVNKDMECLVKDPLHSQTQFSISHYAGAVVYEASHFVKKNTDKLPNDLVDCAARSSNILMKTEFEVREILASNGRSKGKHSSQSVSSKFRSQLHSLMQTIQKTRTRYVRCIKPNPQKEPKKIDLQSSVQQLRCAGVVAAVTMSRVAYPNRLTLESALERFSCISNLEHHQFESDCQNAVTVLMNDILSHFEGTSGAYACGKSRIYFKAGALEFLEAKRMHKLGVLAGSVQRIARGFIARSRYLTLCNTSIFLQSLARRNQARLSLYRACFAATTISCWTRCIQANKMFHRLRQKRASTMIQTRFRIMSAKKLFTESRSSTITIQKIWRGALQRPAYRAMVAEAEEEARVNTKIAALQKRLADAEMKWIKADKARIHAEQKNFVGGEEEKKIDDGANMPGGSKELLDESNRMIDYLKKENFKLRSSAYLLKSDMNEVKHANIHLCEQYEALHDSHEAIRQHATEMSQGNFKLNVKNNELKRKYSEAKKSLKESILEHKSDKKKLKDLMNAKQKDFTSEISRLQVELAEATAGQLQKSQNISNDKKGISTSRHGQRRKGGSRRSPRNLQVETTMRATVKCRKSPNMGMSINPSPSTHDDERWGHDGFFELNKEDSPSTSSKNNLTKTRKGRNRKSRKNRTPVSATSNSSCEGKRVVSPDISKQSIQREASMTSLQGALDNSNHKISRAEGRSKHSSLAMAAAKPSSLAERARKR